MLIPSAPWFPHQSRAPSFSARNIAEESLSSCSWIAAIWSILPPAIHSGGVLAPFWARKRSQAEMMLGTPFIGAKRPKYKNTPQSFQTEKLWRCPDFTGRYWGAIVPRGLIRNLPSRIRMGYSKAECTGSPVMSRCSFGIWYNSCISCISASEEHINAFEWRKTTSSVAIRSFIDRLIQRAPFFCTRFPFEKIVWTYSSPYAAANCIAT